VIFIVQNVSKQIVIAVTDKFTHTQSHIHTTHRCTQTKKLQLSTHMINS